MGCRVLSGTSESPFVESEVATCEFKMNVREEESRTGGRSAEEVGHRGR